MTIKCTASNLPFKWHLHQAEHKWGMQLHQAEHKWGMQQQQYIHISMHAF